MNLELFSGKTTGRLPKLQTIEDKIAAYEVGLIPLDDLTSEEQRIRERWHKIWARLISFHSPTQAVNAHVKQCKENGHPISLRTAWNDYRKSTLLFGNLIETSKKAKRLLVEEYALKTFQMATNAKDIEGMNRAVANIIKLNGLDRSDPEIAAHDSGRNTFVMAVYVKGAERPKIVNLDALHKIPEAEYAEILQGIEADEITEVEIKALMESENGNKAS